MLEFESRALDCRENVSLMNDSLAMSCRRFSKSFMMFEVTKRQQARIGTARGSMSCFSSRELVLWEEI